MSGNAGAASGSGVSADQERYDKWKQLTPYLYDWLTNHNLTWPSLSCRWGRVVNDTKWKTQQLLYLSEQTSGDEPNKLTILMADVVKPRTAAAEVIRQFDESKHSAHIKASQTIFHPGEVNKIREVPGHESILVTHTDAPEVLVWSLERQPNRANDKGSARQQMSIPDLVLEGHTDIAEFAVGVSSREPLVASGGRDTNVLIWSIADHVTSLTMTGSKDNATKGVKLQHRTKLEGHTATIEDVVWKPDSASELASVGDDRGLLLWDTRAGTKPAQRKLNAHGAHDLHTVDWSGLRDELLATGAADGTLKIWDRRKLGSKDAALHTFDLHTEALMHVEWCPHRPGVLASCGEDQVVYVWDLDQQRRPPGEPEAKRAKGAYPPQLLLTHAGHRASVVDFHWNPAEPFTLMSVADESSLEKGGGTLQLWRISDLLTRPEEEVLAELEPHRDFIITGSKSAAAAVDAKGKAPALDAKPGAKEGRAEAAAAGAGNGSASAAAGVEKDAEDGGPNAEMKDPPAKSEPQTSCGEKDESSEGAAAEEDAAKCAAMETD